jgi:hypothetical protein
MMLVNFMAILFILLQFIHFMAIFGIFFPFWSIVSRKIWQPRRGDELTEKSPVFALARPKALVVVLQAVREGEQVGAEDH